MKRIVLVAALAAGSLWVPFAAALGLGDIDVRSQLSQRFDASIPLTAASADELTELKVSLASTEEYERAGVTRDAALTALRFSVKSEGAPRIDISSTTPINEPYLQLLLDVRGGGQRLVRQYTILLDPPSSASRQKAKPVAPVVKPAAVAETKPQALPPPKPVAAEPPVTVIVPEAPAAVPPSASAGRDGGDESFFETPEEVGKKATAVDPGEGLALYGPVKPGETLWSIAVNLRPDASVMVDQVLLALYKANPRAFESGLNSLLKGAMLRVPTREQMLSVSPEDAHTEISRLRIHRPRAEPKGPLSRRKPTLEPATIAPPPPATLDTPAPAPAVVPATAAAKPEVKTEAGTATPPAGAGSTAETATASADAAAAATPTEIPPGPDAGAAAPASDADADKAAPAVDAPPADASDADIVETGPSPRSEPAGGLVETLLLPMLLGLLAISGLLWLISRVRARRAAAPEVAPPAASLRGGVKTSAQHAAEPELGIPAAAPGFAAKPAAKPAEPPVAAMAGLAAAPLVSESPASDPLAEADFNIAYGLHDEAVPLLRGVFERDPSRTDVGTKLVKSLLALGRHDEVEALMPTLMSRLSPEQLRELVGLGWGKAAGPAAEPVPEAEIESLPVFETPKPVREPPLELPPVAAPTPIEIPPVAEEPDAAPATEALEFDLDAFELPPVEAAEPGAPAAAASEKADAIDFDLSGFDLNPLAAAATPAPAAAPRHEDASGRVEFDLSGFDLAPPANPAPAPAAAPASSDFGSGEVRLDDFDFGPVTEDTVTISGDESGTKLDLARAYIEMGDADMARGLLREVLEQGSEAQRSDAQALLRRLS